ncbi:hypothetical protein HELRODRAFT_165467 [Helobdella robusta]|uniref:Uncharacterized protein n=1 Tax=Helobdella robusta TaxID=6412 RepID=T1EWU8_HELRO|nr:hypothetical protein HELRODRAFT_165467 [Helobdella robusta]ESN91433.1 hypothetical protein HELRODRAFT_165467 [Helobdella robusta]
MDVEEDLLIVDEVGVSNQQAGREQTSARPVFSDSERVYCRVADPGQERLRQSEGSGRYSYADAVRDCVLHFRLARKSDNIRPLLVKLKFKALKDLIMKNQSNLKKLDDDLKGINIGHDMTKEQRADLKN